MSQAHTLYQQKPGRNPKVWALSYCSSPVPTGAKEQLGHFYPADVSKGAAGQMKLCPGCKPKLKRGLFCPISSWGSWEPASSGDGTFGDIVSRAGWGPVPLW